MDVEKRFEELDAEFRNIARVKSDFDILKFTMDKEGPFIAHQRHFIARQYYLTLSELNKLYLDKQEKERLIIIYTEKIKNNNKQEYIDGKYIFYDIEIERIQNELMLLEYQIIDKKERCNRYEIIRLHLIKTNGGPITDDQYQKEEPFYWEWNLANQAKQEMISRQTGISKGVLEAIDMGSRRNSFLPNYKINNLVNQDGLYNIDYMLNNKYHHTYCLNHKLSDYNFNLNLLQLGEK